MFFAALSSVLFPAAVLAQARNVTGVVTDPSGDALIGAMVAVEGTSTATVTAVDGTYSINVPAGAATLSFSYVGMAPQTVSVAAGQTVLDVTLQHDSQVLDEVVVVGYGTVNRRDLIGSVASVNSEKLSQMPVASVVEAMAGRMAGVSVTASEGDPDADIKIRVRGTGSITQNSAPLYIVDGFPVESISDIPSSEIESIDVLKDTFSTAIYGSAGANGVLIVTTKSGKSGRTTVNYNMYAGFKNMSNKEAFTVMKPYDYVRSQYEFALLADDVPANYETYFGTFADMDMYQGMAGNDWIDQVFGLTGSTFNHNISVSGGDEKFNYTAGYSHLSNSEIMLNSDYKRNNLNFKGQFKPNKRVTLDFSVRYSDVRVFGAGANSLNDAGSTSGQTARLKNAIIYKPIPYVGAAASDDEQEADFSDQTHPVLNVTDNDSRRHRRDWNANAAFTWEIIDNLRFKVEGGILDNRQTDDKFYGMSTYYSLQNAGSRDGVDFRGMPATQYQDRKQDRVRNTTTLYYDFKNVLGEDHHLNLLLGEEYVATKTNKLTTWVEGLPKFFDSEMAWKFMESGENPRSTDLTYSDDDRKLSFFTRANYDYKSKYYVSFTMRADGSSKFMPNNPWGYFPSAAVSWRISEEWGLADAAWLDDLKLRYSYGTAGNNGIPTGQTKQQFGPNATAWLSQGGVWWGAGQDMPNPDLKWETTYTHNLALDFSFWNSRLSGTVEVYQSDVKDLLIHFPVAGSGYRNQYRNMGWVRNKGIELSLSAAIVRKTDWGINFDGNIAFNQNRVMDLGDMEQITASAGMFSTEVVDYDYLVTEGRPIGDIYGWVTEGRYSVDDFDFNPTNETWVLKEGVPSNTTVLNGDRYVRPGGLKLADLNDDGVVDLADRKVIGNVQPKFTGGFSLSAYAYGFDMAANFTYSVGGKIYNANKIEYTTMRNRGRNLLDMVAPGEGWTNVDWTTGELITDPATLAAANTGTTMWSPMMARRVVHSWAVEDSSFLRLASFTLGYTFPQKLTQKIRLNNVRIYATGTNLFLLTKYTGYDPEVDTRRATPLTPNVDYSAYPKSRSWVFGLNLSF